MSTRANYLTLITESIRTSHQMKGNEEKEMIRVTMKNGYANAAGITATATEGAKVKMMGVITVKCVTSSQINEWIQINEKILDITTKEKLHEDQKNGVIAGGLLTNIFGFFAGGYGSVKNSSKDYNYSKKEHEDNYNAIKQLSELTSEEVNIKIEAEVMGLSSFPTELTVFVELTTFEFEDGTKLKVISSNKPEVGDTNGDTSVAKTLNVSMEGI